MIVTISGMIGSGKTTAAQHINELLKAQGLPATYWRFQSLPCFTLLRRPGVSARVTAKPTRQRGSGYRRKKLTAAATLGYVARIIAFGIFYRWHGTGEWRVSNRYFYDSFAHFELKSVRERLYGSLLERLIPTPDLAILLLASPETIAVRRPQYAAEYISSVNAAYRRLKEKFPALIEISTEPDQPAWEQLHAVVLARTSRQARRL